MSHDALFEQNPVNNKPTLVHGKTTTFVRSASWEIRRGHAPGLHPAFRPERFDFRLHEGFEVVFQRQRVLALQLVTAQLHPHQVAEQRPEKARRHSKALPVAKASFAREPDRLLGETDLSLSSQRNFFRGPITLFPGFSSSSSSDPFFSPSSDCCLRTTGVNFYA